MDPLQPPGWRDWLARPHSLLALHTSCSEPGWLVHCAYWAKLGQARLLDGTLRLAGFVLRRGPEGVFPLSSLDGVQALSFPELADIIVTMETRHPAAAGIDGWLPTQLNVAMMPLGSARAAMREAREQAAGHAKDPYRDAAERLAREPPARIAASNAAAFAAAGFSLALQSIFHRHQGLLEALTFTSAGAAAMFAAAVPDRRERLLRELRAAYGWT